ncbi:MAG: hypothetical protein L0Z62_26535 [Gemmataceae bacterium]|nr:hypothetical protein [Gemmataceae bacterium]
MRAIQDANRELLYYQNHADPAVAQRAMRLLAEVGRASRTFEDPSRLQAYNGELAQRLRQEFAQQYGESPFGWDQQAVRRWLLREQEAHPDSMPQLLEAICQLREQSAERPVPPDPSQPAEASFPVFDPLAYVPVPLERTLKPSKKSLAAALIGGLSVGAALLGTALLTLALSVVLLLFWKRDEAGEARLQSNAELVPDRDFPDLRPGGRGPEELALPAPAQFDPIPPMPPIPNPPEPVLVVPKPDPPTSRQPISAKPRPSLPESIKSTRPTPPTPAALRQPEPAPPGPGKAEPVKPRGVPHKLIIRGLLRNLNRRAGSTNSPKWSGQLMISHKEIMWSGEAGNLAQITVVANASTVLRVQPGMLKTSGTDRSLPGKVDLSSALLTGVESTNRMSIGLEKSAEQVVLSFPDPGPLRQEFELTLLIYPAPVR